MSNDPDSRLGRAANQNLGVTIWTAAGGYLGTRQTVGPQVSAVRRETEGTCDCGAPELESCTRLPIAGGINWAGAGFASRPSVVPSDRVSTQQGTDVPGGRYPVYVPPLYRLHLRDFDCTRLESNARTGNLKLMNLAYVERCV